MMVAPGGTDHEADPGARQHPCGKRRDRDRCVHEHVLAEEHGADERQVAQDRYVNGSELHARESGERFSNQAGQSEPEEREREPGRHLVGDQGLREEGEQQRRPDPGGESRRDADRRRSGGIGGREARYRTHYHHPFDAQVEHPGAFDHELSDRREQQRRRRGNDRQHDGFEPGHVATMRPLHRTRYRIRVSQARMKNSSTPWKTFAVLSEIPSSTCAASPPR